MRKQIIPLIISLFLLSACSSYEEVSPSSEYIKDETTSAKRSKDEAFAIVQNILKEHTFINTTRGGSTEREIDLSKTFIYRNQSKTRSITSDDTLMYVFNFKDSLGFAVISACKNTPALLAISDLGFYDTEKECENDGFSETMQMAAKYVRERFHGDTLHVGPHNPSIIDSIVRPAYGNHLSNRINLKWGGGDIYAKYCEYGNLGCFPVAIMQTAAILRPSNTIRLTYPNRDVDSIVVDWDDMCRHTISFYQNEEELPAYCTASAEAHDNIARLGRQIGKLLEINYNNNNMALWMDLVDDCLHELGFPWLGEFQEYINVSVPTIIWNNGVILMRHNGHAWIVDNYQLINMSNGNSIWGPSCYNHINWGWNGICNGYYLDNIFNTNNACSYDDIPYEHFGTGDYGGEGIKYIHVHL